MINNPTRRLRKSLGSTFCQARRSCRPWQLLSSSTMVFFDPALSGHAGLIASRPAPLGRKDRIRRLGVDCGDGLEWLANWEPGGEYTKTVVVKNVSTKVIKIKYRLPETKFFSMNFPETITLTAGLSKTLQAASRPPPRSPPTTASSPRAPASPLRSAITGELPADPPRGI